MDYFKLLNKDGKSFDKWKKTDRIPKVDESIERMAKQSRSSYNLRSLGTGESELLISEEERETNFHIIGAPGEGKSKFLEYNIRQDINIGNGLCLLDPSDSGDTAKKVLRYCAQIGHKRVLYISPDTLQRYGKIACLRPLQNRNLKQSIGGILEALNIKFSRESKDTPRMTRRLQALLRVLARKNATLYETLYFSEFKNPHQYDFLEFDTDSKAIEQDFRTQKTWEDYFSSTINTLNDFWQPPLSLMVAANQGIDFVKMIREKWIILVNLFPGLHLTPEESQLLGVLIISQINQAIDLLTDDTNSNRWKGKFYLYIDEAGRFATPQIDTILTYKRKSGLRLVIAHHDFDQFENKKVLHSIKHRTGVKVMFNTREPKDRLEMIKSLGYGGAIHPEVAAYANADLPKQYAIIKKNKEDPVRVRIPDTPDIQMDKEVLDSYIESLMGYEWYKTEKEITDQINARIKETKRKNTFRSGDAKVSNNKATHKPDKPAGDKLEGVDKSVGDDQKNSPETKKRKPLKF